VQPPSADSAHSLTAVGLTKHYGGVKALSDVSFSLPAGQTLGVIGPNGAGKSTLLALVSGSIRPTDGSVSWRGQQIDRLPKHMIARSGIGRARQIPRPFRRLTVRQNLQVAANSAIGDHRARESLVTETLQECGLLAREDAVSGDLGLLDLKRLEVARALALNPRLLLLDEVAAGLIGSELSAIADLIERIKRRGLSIVIVEHVQGVIGRLADRAIVLDWGRVIAEGTPQEVAADSKVIEVYFGASVHAQPKRPEKNLTAEARPTTVLDVDNMTVKYGGLAALADVSLKMAEKEMIGIIGANGAGKTTLCRAIAGLVPCQGGQVKLLGADVTRMPAHQRARRGLVICHEGRRLFTSLTVKENLDLGAAFSGANRQAAEQRLAAVFDMFPVLRECAHRLADSMSGGQQQMLAIGRALMANPKVLLLDELSLGLAPLVIENLYGALEKIRALGVSIMLVEQNTHRCLAVADRVYVLERGRISYGGPPSDLIGDDMLRKAYFGTAA
jgi:branched-chain amino acid transport system ATP-binding protein